MFFQCAQLSETFCTDVAGERFLTSVDHEMSFEIVPASKDPITYRTHESFSLRVFCGSYVFYGVADAAGAVVPRGFLVTRRAFRWVGGGRSVHVTYHALEVDLVLMDFSMFLKVAEFSEALVTDVTTKWTFT